MADVARLHEALRQVSQVLDELEIRYMVIGGIANLVWGEPRATQDIDVTVSVPDERLDEVVAALSQRVTPIPADPLDFLRRTRVLPVTTSSGIGVDFIRTGIPYEEEAIRRATVQDLDGVRVRVAAAEDLILHKLASERPRDREDVAGVIRRQRANLDRAYLDPLVESLAETLEQPETWDWYLREVRRAG
jgi:predicted nucleotidyltransferase